MATYRVTNNGRGGLAFPTRTVMPGEADILVQSTAISKSRRAELSGLGFDIVAVRKSKK
jgi:hypothetical protein